MLFLPDGHPKKYLGPKIVYHSVVFLQLASGLKYIHECKFSKEAIKEKAYVHRDIKPENVLIALQQWKVIMKWADLGLSKSVDQQGTYTYSTEIKGTILWLPPEINKQAQTPSEKTRGTVKSDIYAEGLVFGYWLLDGLHPFSNTEYKDHDVIRYNMYVTEDPVLFKGKLTISF